MKISYKNSRGDVVQGMNGPVQFPFTLTIESPTPIDTGCSAATATFKTVSADRFVAFNDASQQKYIEIPEAMIATTSNPDCPIKYRLQIAQPDGAYVDYEDRRYDITTASAYTESYFPVTIDFDETNANTIVTISGSFEDILDFFTDANSGEVFIGVQIIAQIPGSTEDGVGAAQACVGSFKIRRLETTAVDNCADNFIDLLEADKDGNSRVTKYSVPMSTDPANTV